MQIFEAENPLVQTQKVVELLTSVGTKEYILMLSGGDSPQQLYTFMSHAFNVPMPKIVGLVDERWGREKFHKNSNALMIRDSGFMGRFAWESVEWMPILTELSNPELEAERYEKNIVTAFEKYKDKVVAVMGMSMDGHTAGILPGSKAVTDERNVIYYKSDDEFKDRITVTINCIKRYFKKVILLLNTQEKLELFNQIMQNETDISKYPVLVLKDHPDVSVIHTQ